MEGWERQKRRKNMRMIPKDESDASTFTGYHI